MAIDMTLLLTLYALLHDLAVSIAYAALVLAGVGLSKRIGGS